MIIENAAVKLDGETIEPRHKIEIYCSGCGRDVDATNHYQRMSDDGNY